MSMTVNPGNWRVRQKLQTAWQGVQSAFEGMQTGCTLTPQGVDEAFVLEPDLVGGAIKCSVNPIILNLPERANNADRDLFIAMDGWLAFDAATVKDDLRTTSFSTRVGYFKQRENFLDHVYGGHYDMDENKAGHPVLHSQMRSQKELFAAKVADVHAKNPDGEDYIKGLLKTVRIPSAQMDIFSVLLQVCADHLIDKDSSAEVKAAFERLATETNFFRGVGHRVGKLNSPPGSACYRSLHWYP